MEKREKGKGWEKGLRIEGGIIDKEGKRARVAKGVRFKGGQREGLRVGKRERVSVMVGKKGRTKGEKRGQGLKVGKRGKG